MEYKYLTARQVNATLWVEINNPPVNFLTTDLLEELYGLVKKVRKDASIRVLILTGGRDDFYIMHFSIPELLLLTMHNRRLLLNILVEFRLTRLLLSYAMTLMNWLMDCSPWYEDFVLKLAKQIRGYSTSVFLWLQMTRFYHAVERLNKVTIAAINGSCNGGGTELSACFDFRFMIKDRDYTIGQPECLVSIVPGGGGTQRLPRLLGRAKALEMMLRGHQLTPEVAKQIGLITDMFDKAEFCSKVQEFADLMSVRPPVAVDAIKQCVLRGMNTTLRHGLSIELAQSVRCLDTRDTVMALAAYAQYISENIDPIDYQNIKSQEVNDILRTTIYNLEQARIFKEFEGK